MKYKIIFIGIISILTTIFIGAFIIYKISPHISLNGIENITLTVNNNYIEEGVKASVNKQDVSSRVKISGSVDPTKIGKYVLTYKVSNYFLTSQTTRIVEVIDDIKPTISLVGNNIVNICPGIEYQEEGYSAVDNYDGDLTKNVIVTKDNNNIKYEVSDSSKNKEEVTRTINHIDNEIPNLSLLGNQNISLIVGSKYYESGYIAIDNCDGNITSNVTVSGTIDVNKVGNYTLKYQVRDNAGNVSEIERYIKILSPTKPKNSTIYLTFDDGPGNVTSRILDILKEENVKATFFVLNRSSELNYLLQRIVNEGHTIALHGNSHNYRTVYSSVDAYFNDLNIIRNKVLSVTGVDSKIMRFVGGSSNTASSFNPGIMTTLTQEVTTRGYKYFDWNIGSADTTNISSYQVYSNVIKYLGSQSTYVVLMHDYDNNYKTVNALRDIIKYGKGQGYKFDKITINTPQIKHRLSN